MRSPNKVQTDRRQTERRTNETDRRSGVTRVATDRRVVEQRGLAESMVDALEDILEWERTSERSIKVAGSSN